MPDPTFRTGDSGELTTALWRCGTSRVFINSLDPTGGSSATYERRVVRSVEVCKEWKAAIGGGETCVRRGKENQETFVQSRITLRAVRISTAENSGVVPTTRGRNELVGSAK